MRLVEMPARHRGCKASPRSKARWCASRLRRRAWRGFSTMQLWNSGTCARTRMRRRCGKRHEPSPAASSPPAQPSNTATLRITFPGQKKCRARSGATFSKTTIPCGTAFAAPQQVVLSRCGLRNGRSRLFEETNSQRISRCHQRSRSRRVVG